MPRNQEVIRQWKLLHALESSRHGASIDALAGELDVTTRTIRRDLAALQEAGFALYDERDDAGRVRWRIDGHVLHGLESGFTLAELCALYLSRHLLESVAGTPFQRDLTNAFGRIEKMLSPRMRQFLDRLPSVLAAKPGPRSRGGESSPDIVARLLEATLHFRTTTMRYHSVSSGRVKDYVVHPYRLAFAQGGLYLLAYVPEYKSVRTFAIDRIASASLEKQTFTPKESVGEDVFANSLGVNTGPAERVDIEFEAQVAPYVRARVWHPSQVLDDVDGRLRLSLKVCHDWALRSWILSWGPFARVITPASLAREIKTDLDAATAHYGGAAARAPHAGCLLPKRSGSNVFLETFLLIIFAGPSFVRFYTDWLWFGEVGYQSVFLTMLRSQGTLFTIAFVVAAAWLSFNLRYAVTAVGELRPVFVTREGIEIALPGRRQLQMLASAAAIIIAVMIGLYAAGQWHVWMAWQNAVPFGQADPLLGHDVSFYVFSLPFLQFVRGLAQGLVLLAAIGSGALYFLTGSMNTRFPASFVMTPQARRHLSLLAAAFLLLLAFGAWLQRPEFLIGGGGATPGAGYADVHGRMPATILLMAACIVGAGLAVLQAFSYRNWPIPLAVGLYLLVSIGGEGYSVMLQRFVVTPNEQAREVPYIQHNIDATRRAFGLDDVERREISGEAMLTRQDLEANAATLQNVRLWDHQPLLDTFSAIQEIRTYYDFASIDNDRYRIDGSLRQVMLSARELNSNSLPNRTWVNERLTFTHGYGLTLGPVNQVTEQGLPVLFVQDLPPVTSAGLDVEEPSVYFGELSNDYVIVGTDAAEFHYPRGDDPEYTSYDGRGGVPLGSLWRKLMFALRFGSYQILLSDDIGPESRILFNRRIGDRVRIIAGDFLRFDADPYLVLADGRLYWMYDAYTTSRRYPYSTPAADGSNYWRNSVKFVIDAYHGSVTAYLADERDPIAATYARIFPGLFKPLAEMPASLRDHVRYPEDIFAVQSRIFATYHMTQPSIFYNREDQWEIPTIDESAEGGATTMQPYYTIMRLPGEPEPEFIQMLPFTPRQRENLAAWLVAHSDGENYGRLRVFEFPKQKLVFGPRQVVARISQDQTIAPQITLWNQQGSQVIWGTLMVIPIEESLIYVRPLYLRAQGGRIPELTRVIVAYNENIVMEETLEQGLDRLFGAGAAPPPSPDGEIVQGAQAPGDPATEGRAPSVTPENAALAAQAQGHYDRAVAAQRAGDWAAYGEELRQLGEVLSRMRAQ